MLASKTKKHGAPRRERNSTTLDKVLRRVVAPGIGIAFALWGGAVVTGLSSIGAANAPAPASAAATPVPAKTASAAAKAARILDPEIAAAKPQAGSLAAAFPKSARLAKAAPACGAGCGERPVAAAPQESKRSRRLAELFGAPDAGFAAKPERKARFDAAIRQASLSPQKLASAFADAGLKVAPAKAAVAADMPHPVDSRFRRHGARTGAELLLAYADPSPTGVAEALESLSTIPPVDNGALAPEVTPDDGAALEPDFPDTPESTPLPVIRPEIGRRDEPAKPERAEREEKPAERTRETKRTEREKEVRTASARPDDRPSEKASKGAGKGLKHLFGGTRAGNGVAVYDISAAKVYMPDGSVLEAHSGIGKMADNPKYAHVKMKGPTPPHTYNLRMREKRFHGVEAIRMLPVDGKNKFGRDGFLTHSYLLRGGREESHGCVAFANYDKFLKAFKAGKVKQMVVVPSGGRAAAGRIASSSGRKGSDEQVASSAPHRGP